MAPKQVDVYNIDRPVARGAFGEIWRGRHAVSGEAVTVKVVRRQVSDEADRLRREVLAMKRLTHENVVRFLDLKKTTSNFYLFVDSYPLGDLGQHLRTRGRLPEATAWQYISQIVAGLRAMHVEARLPHGDLKPGNILLSQGSSTAASHGCRRDDMPILKLANFGNLTIPTWSLYAAPEALSDAAPSAKADVWAVGLIFLESLVGTPFLTVGGAELAERQLRRAKKNRSAERPWEGRSIEACLSLNPAERPSCAALLPAATRAAAAATAAAAEAVAAESAARAQRR